MMEDDGQLLLAGDRDDGLESLLTADADDAFREAAASMRSEVERVGEVGAGAEDEKENVTVAATGDRKVVFFEEEQSARKVDAQERTAQATAPSSIDEYYASAGGREEEGADGESDAEEPASAIPMDKLKNGAANALKFWQWGLSKVQEKSKEVGEQLQQNENVRHATEKIGEVYETTLKPGLSRVKETAAPIVGAVVEGADELRQRSRPAFEELASKAEEGWQVTRVKVGEATEACRPGLGQAAERARAAFENVTSKSFNKGSDGSPGGPESSSTHDAGSLSGMGSPFADI